MKKSILAIAVGAVLAVATLTPTPADARCGIGCGVGLGLFGGLVLGGAIAHSRPYYYDGPVVAARGRCFAEEEVWSPRRQAYIIRTVRVPCY